MGKLSDFVEYLNDNNYYVWECKIRHLLMRKKLYTNVMKDTDNPLEFWFRRADDKAQAIIGENLNDSQYIHIRDAKTAKEMLTKLKNYHESRITVNEVNIMREIWSLKIEEGGDIRSHIEDLLELFEKLQFFQESQMDYLRIAILFASLPESYNSIIEEKLENCDEKLTFDAAKKMLIAEYERRCQNKDEGTPASRSEPSSTKNPVVSANERMLMADDQESSKISKCTLTGTEFDQEQPDRADVQQVNPTSTKRKSSSGTVAMIKMQKRMADNQLATAEAFQDVAREVKALVDVEKARLKLEQDREIVEKKRNELLERLVNHICQ